MDEIKIEADHDIENLESGNNTYGERITYVAISPDGSIVATFNPCELW
jgi:hypothetical protein